MRKIERQVSKKGLLAAGLFIDKGKGFLHNGILAVGSALLRRTGSRMPEVGLRRVIYLISFQRNPLGSLSGLLFEQELRIVKVSTPLIIISKKVVKSLI